MDMTTTMNMAPTATSPAMFSASSHSMDMGEMGGSCKISMLWNWYTIDSCFISRSWHNTSSGMFAGSCIGVILLVMALEFLRRSVKEYDRHIVRTHHAALIAARHESPTKTSGGGSGSPVPTMPAAGPAPFRPTVLQQVVRALLHTVQFAVAYFIMLLAMYYNGYIIICIFIGAFLGSFVFHWETVGGGAELQTTAAREATVCCG